MEVIKERRGRVAAGKHASRPVTVHYRTDPILADGAPRDWRGWALAVPALLTVSGILPMAVADAVCSAMGPVPSWAVLSCLIAAMAGAAAWVWRTL